MNLFIGTGGVGRWEEERFEHTAHKQILKLKTAA
jgi:hypothetical protein